MDTNYNQMKLELEEMEKKYNDVLKGLDGLIHTIYGESLYQRRDPETYYLPSEDLLRHLSFLSKNLAHRFGLYPYNQKEVRNP